MKTFDQYIDLMESSEAFVVIKHESHTLSSNFKGVDYVWFPDRRDAVEFKKTMEAKIDRAESDAYRYSSIGPTQRFKITVSKRAPAKGNEISKEQALNLVGR